MIALPKRLRLPWPSLLAFLAILGLTGGLYLKAREAEIANTRLDFEQAAALRINALRTEVAQTIELLHLVSRHLALTEGGDQAGFQHFLSPMLEHHPYLQAVGYAPRVSREQRPAFEREARRIHPDFAITVSAGNGRFEPAPEKAEYYPFLYAEPLADNAPAIGFDAATEIHASGSTPRLDAIAQALASRTMAVTAPVTLALKKASGQTGVLVFSPLYRPGFETEDSPLGFSILVIRVGKMLQWSQRTASSPTGKEVDLFLEDVSGPTPIPMEGRRPAASPSLERTEDLDMPGGRLWRITARPTGASFSLAPGTDALGVLGAGTILALVVGLLVHLQAGKDREIRHQVRARTMDLADANRQLTQEIGRRQDSEKLLKALSALHQAVLNNAGYAIVASDNDGVIKVFNPAAERILGYSAEELIDQARPSLFHCADHDPDPDGSHFRALVAPLASLPPGTAHTLETAYWTRDGRAVPVLLTLSTMVDEDGEQLGYIGISHDISSQKAAETRITHLAHYDPLTELPNRLFLREELGRAIAAARRASQQLGIMFVDLDRFKNINDSLGHFVGDALLQATANRLRHCLREADLVARMGGDEFVIILNPLEHGDQAVEVALRVQGEISAPVTIGEHQLTVTPSIGIALYPEDGEDSDSLIQNADTAMYSAKEQGRNSYRFFTRYMNERVSTRLAVESSIRRALQGNLFSLVFQPQYDVASGALIGAEALIRMGEAAGGISPAQFIPVAEESGLIMPIGEWVLRETLRIVQGWQEAGLAVVPIAVNASARQFEQPDFADQVEAALREFSIPASLIEIELTESALMRSVGRTQEALQAIKSRGLRIAIDDFGTGFSSLAYLRRFPIDRLKIDRSFVHDLATDGDGHALVRAIIGLAHDLKLEVIAEGVETDAQADLLRRWGCDAFQGYRFGRPMTPEALAEQLKG